MVTVLVLRQPRWLLVQAGCWLMVSRHHCCQMVVRCQTVVRCQMLVVDRRHLLLRHHRVSRRLVSRQQVQFQDTRIRN